MYPKSPVLAALGTALLLAVAPAADAAKTHHAAGAAKATKPAAAAKVDAPKTTIVLVHGAFADGSSWSPVIPLLAKAGYNVVAVQNPLTSLAADTDATTRVIDQQQGPVVLVGHSWGGTVITQAGVHDKVKALVYIAAFANNEGESINDVLKTLPPPPWAGGIRQDAKGYLTLSADTISGYFAQDVTPASASVIAATQAPWFHGCMDDKPTVAAWRSKPSWYVLTGEDRIVPASLQETISSKIKATVARVPSSHVPMLSRPQEVADAIVQAAKSVK